MSGFLGKGTHDGVIVVTVIGPFKFQNLVAARKRARQAHGVSRGFGTGSRIGYFFRAGNIVHQPLGQLDGNVVKRPEHVCTPGHLLLGGFDYGRMGMTQNERPRPTDIVDVLVAVDVPHA